MMNLVGSVAGGGRGVCLAIGGRVANRGTGGVTGPGKCQCTFPFSTFSMAVMAGGGAAAG